MNKFNDIMSIDNNSIEPLEKVIEQRVSNHAKQHGWLSFKFMSPATPSVCDRIFINRFGVVLFVEFKRKGRKLSPKQAIHAESLSIHNANVFMIDDIEDGKALIDKWHNSVSIINHDFSNDDA